MKRGHQTDKHTHIATTRPTRPKGPSWRKFNSIVHIGRFDSLLFFHFGPIFFCLFKKLSYFWKINGNLLFMKGVTKNVSSSIQHILGYFLCPSRKTNATFSIQFFKLGNNADSELYIFLLKSILWWLEKVSFQTA